MPSREDEYWAAMKEPQKQGLCPKCGSSNISYNTRYKSWRCNKCEHNFPIPSYGPDGFGKNQQSIYQNVNTTSDTKLLRQHKREHNIGENINTKFIVIKTTLILLAFVCLGFAGWTGYLLYKREISSAEGIILLIVANGILIWNIFALSKYRVVVKTLILLFLAVILLGCSVSAFAGVEPFLKVKNGIVNSINGLAMSGPHGTYSATILGLTEKIIFSGNTITVIDPMFGSHTYTYVLVGDGTQIDTTDIVTGKISSKDFSYLPEYDIVVMSGVQFTK